MRSCSDGGLATIFADAQWVYDHFLVGDVVDVRHTPKSLPVSDGLGDWTVPYHKYGA